MSTLGENETIESISFIERNKNRRKYKDECTDRKYEWSELKTSILIKELILNKPIIDKLFKFLEDISSNLLKEMGIERNKAVDMFTDDIQKGVYHPQYNVGQTLTWLHDNDRKWDPDIQGMMKDFYAFSNFLIWIWHQIRDQRFFHRDEWRHNGFKYFTMINFFQQNITAAFNVLRGERPSHTAPYTGSNQIGISVLKMDYLKRHIPKKETYAWPHPGIEICMNLYRGQYGKHMKKYKDSNSFYGSLLCSFSTSSQFILFSYLLNILNTQDLLNTSLDIRNVILSACLILCGDGGHNIREVLFGLLCPIIILNNFISDLTVELQIYFKNTANLSKNYDKIKDIEDIKKSFLCGMIYNYSTKTCKNNGLSNVTIIKNHFLSIINACSIWQPFIYDFYILTKDINIIGVFKNDLDDYNSSILIDKDKSFGDVKSSVYSFIFNTILYSDTFALENLDAFQIFFALDNNRYLLSKKSFKKSPNIFIKGLIEKFDKDILINVSNILQTRLDSCHTHINSDRVPFAFQNKSNCMIL